MQISALPVRLATPAFGALLFASLLAGAVLPAEESSPRSMLPGSVVARADSCLSAVKQNGGVVSLYVDCPWTVYTKASVEVRLLVRDQPEQVRPRPTYFSDYYLKGDTLMTFGQCLEAGYGVGVARHLKVEHSMPTLDFLGQRNSLGRPAVTVAWKRPEGEDSQDKSQEELALASQRGPWAAFCSLEDWSVSRHRLCLDLPPAYFAKPGTLLVWLLRGDTILWAKRLDWKGYPNHKG